MEQIGQRAAVYISVDVILKAVPEGEGAAVARAVALFAVGGQTGHRRDGVALSRAQDFAGRVLGGGGRSRRYPPDLPTVLSTRRPLHSAFMMVSRYLREIFCRTAMSFSGT